ncbi:MAG: thiol:disulfide interchange protein DsbA/DsbL [Burkholderiaceae bacterium]
MQRRHFSLTLLAASALPRAGAQTAATPIEGTHYVRLSQPMALPPGGKIEVIEFFWYGCPHCNSFEPALEAWVRKLPADVAFRRVPMALREQPPYLMHQRIYYALETLGLLDAMHRKVFYAIHSDRLPLDKPADIAAFMQKNGVDGAKFAEAFDSAGVVGTKVPEGNRLVAAYKIDGVPALGVQRRFYTSGALAGSNERSLGVADHLIQRVRKSA